VIGVSFEGPMQLRLVQSPISAGAQGRAKKAKTKENIYGQ
jgi:hypothetical protein